jgi:hypothetical protein
MISLEELMEYGEIHEESLRFDSPSFDTAIVGIDYNGRLVYDYDRMIAELMEKDNITEEEAIDFIDYNTIRSLPYYGEYAPIILIRNFYNE